VVGVLIRMKLRVLSHSLGGARAASFIIGALVGLAAGALALFFVAAGFNQGLSLGTTIASAMFLLWTIGWLVGPIIMGGGDETLRPENFALLPLSPTKLAFGLLGASIAGVPPVATVVAFLGLVVGAALLGPLPVIVAVITVLPALAFTVLLSRVVISLIGTVLGSRRGKDLGVLLAALAGLSYLPLRYVATALVPVLLENNPGLGDTLRWLPTGWAPSAVEGAASGNWLVVIGAVLGLAVVDGGLLYAWARLLQYRLTTPQTNVGPAKARKNKAVGVRRGLLPATPTGAVLGKELRMWWRDARRRAMLLTSMLIGVFIPVFSAAGGRSGTGGAVMLPFAALWIVGFSMLQVSNLYGFDGTSVWQTIVTPGAARADVRGRQWAWGLIVGPIAILAALVLPAVVGAWWTYPWVLGVLPAMLGGGAGFMLLLSVYWAFPMPVQRGGNPFNSGNRPGCTRGLVRLLSMVFLLVIALPSLALLIVGQVEKLPVLSWLAVPAGVLTGAVTAWWLGRLAERRLLDRGPELLAQVKASS
jgi:ABC-2 type transport system permease protein